MLLEKVCRVIKRVPGVLEDVMVFLQWVPGVLRARKDHLGALRKVQEFLGRFQVVLRRLQVLLGLIAFQSFPGILEQVSKASSEGL